MVFVNNLPTDCEVTIYSVYLYYSSTCTYMKYVQLLLF